MPYQANFISQVSISSHPLLELLQSGVRLEEVFFVLVRLASQDVPVGVVHLDVGLGAHCVAVKYLDGLPNWNENILIF